MTTTTFSVAADVLREPLSRRPSCMTTTFSATADLLREPVRRKRRAA